MKLYIPEKYIQLAVLLMAMLLTNIVYTEIRLSFYSPYDLRVERTYDLSVWLRLDYADNNINDIEIPLLRPPIPIYNDVFEIIRWEYLFGHYNLNISNSPAYRDAILLVYAPRDVLQLFSNIVCQWHAENDFGQMEREQFTSVGAYYLAQDGRIENTIWQAIFNSPLDVVITLTV